MQHAIIHDLGWRSLRPVQELTIDAILDGCNAVVLAPTAGGKTEASIFPVLSRILTENLRPVAALYVCPIRALLNNQEERLQSYARMVGLEVFKWHGDVADSKKQRFRQSPGHVLMTTPESLEVMMISERTDAKALFEGLSTVIIDEVHAFAADDRGAHLASLLERLVALTGRDIQRIGLSATVGNPLVIGAFSASDAFEGPDARLRITNAVGPEFGLVTPVTAIGDLDTDVPQDFDATSGCVTVPHGAAFLFLGAWDAYYSDNGSAGTEAFGVTIARD